MSKTTEIFDNYLKEWNTLSTSISEKLVSLYSLSGEQRKLVSNSLAREIEEAEEIIGQMEMELLSQTVDARGMLTSRVKGFKEQIKGFKKDLSTSNANADREALMGGAASAAAADQRARVMQGSERLQDGSRRLEEAKRIAMETEHIGISTLEDLNRQREQLERTKDTLNSADTWITKSQGLIKGMQNRLATNKVLSASIIIMLIALILIIVYWKYM